MKRNIILLLILLFSISIIACSKKQASTKEDVIKLVEKKGKENIDWKDFEHLERLIDEEKVYDAVVNVYKLDNNVKLLLIGNGYENKPFHINIIDGNEKINLK